MSEHKPQFSTCQGVLAYCMRYINIAKSDNKTSLTLPVFILMNPLCFSEDATRDERIIGIDNAMHALATFGYKVTMTYKRHPEFSRDNETPTDEVYHELIIEWDN